MWKFQDFSVTQISSEINFGEFWCSKSAFFCHFWGLWILVIWWFSTISNCENSWKSILRASKNAKMVVFDNLKKWFHVKSEWQRNPWISTVHSVEIQQFFYCLNFTPRKKILPRVRLELTAFRLWDWRAAYCATEACVNFFNHSALYLFFQIWVWQTN